MREDLLVDDIADEGQTLGRDQSDADGAGALRRGGGGAALRAVADSVGGHEGVADTLAVAINDLGLAVPQAWVHNARWTFRSGGPRSYRW